MAQIIHRFGDNKYTVIFDETTGKLVAFRYDQPWRFMVDDALVFAMLQDHIKLQEQSEIDDQQIESLLGEVECLKNKITDSDKLIQDLRYRIDFRNSIGD